MSQEEAAAQSAISKKTLSNYESGATIPRADRLLVLARLYKLPVTWFLISGEGGPPASTSDDLDRLVWVVTKLDATTLNNLTNYAFLLYAQQQGTGEEGSTS